MIKHEIQTTLDQPPERVFDFLVDFRNEPDWNPDCLSVEKTSDGPISIGTTFSSKMKGVGRIESQIVTLDRPAHCSVKDRARAMDSSFEFRFAPSGPGTHVSIAMRMQPRGPMRLLEPILGPMMKRKFDELPERIRRGIDSTAGRARAAS
jgi:uncharacterized protein YndB with AHSA1/START domain